MYRTISIVLIFIFSTSLHSQRLDVEAISSFEEFRYRLFDIAPDGKWYIILENDELLTSTDEGENWTMISYPDTFDISRIKYFDSGELLLRSTTASILGNDSNWKSLPSLDGFSLIQVQNDTIYCALENEVYLSTDRGETLNIAFTTEDYENITKMFVTDRSVFLLGSEEPDNRTNLQSFFRYNKRYNKVDSLRINSSSIVTQLPTIRLIDINNDDEFGLTTFRDNRGSDGIYEEAAYGLKSRVAMHDVKVHQGKVYFTYNQNGLGVYDLETRILEEYVVDQMGKIHAHDGKIYIADRNKILEVSEFVNEAGQIKVIVPDLKRTYTNAEAYTVANDGTPYADTGYNIFAYDDLSQIWRQLDLDYDNIIDWTINAESTLYVLSTTNFHIINNNGLEVVTKPFNNCLLYTSPSPRDRTRSRMPSSA